jgi:minor extracellular serine protease Vpr
LGELVQQKSILALAIAALTSGILAATSVHAVQPTPRTSSEDNIIPAVVPQGVGNQSVTLVVQLSGASVAEQQGSAGRKLSKAEKTQLKQQLKSAQAPLRGSIAGFGGTVVADYQSAYNGLKVRIGRDKVAALASLPGVVGVHPVRVYQPTNERSIPYLGVPSVWGGVPGLRGEGVKVAIIDTGIDYTHANFGGPGTIAAYTEAHAHQAEPANPSLFGPNAPRVKGGIDLVGDDYDAAADAGSPKLIPHPDPNPLDCGGHGSHVAGSAAGSGVTSTGATYAGPYDANTISSKTWTIGPGVAPKAELYAVRVFGCAGSTDVVVDAIEWAVDNDMDVINMSLGSPIGSNDEPDAVATNNAAKAGIIVATAAGNNGPNPYIVGSPSVATAAISTAANDSTASFPGAQIAIPSGNLTAINANGAALPPTSSYTVKVMFDPGTTTVSLGCSVDAFGGPNSLPPNTIAVVRRGTCARVARAIFGQQAGAAAVVMINNAAALPPYEGPITSNPDTGIPYNVMIPFFGVSNSASQGGKLAAANGQPAVVTPLMLANPAFAQFASFSSGGPRAGDSALKPDITAPGVSIFSTGVGTGNGGAFNSGTSMASPHVAGVGALMRQAHPTWTVDAIKAAIVNTGDPSRVAGYRTSLGGSGLVQPIGATQSQVIAAADGEPFAVTANFGYAELNSDFTKNKTISLRNTGSSPATFNVAQALPAGVAHSLAIDKSSVTVPAGGKAQVKITLNVPVAGVGPSNDLGDLFNFHEVAGIVQFTPATAADNGGVALRVPYYFVPRALSDVATSIGSLSGTDPSAIATVTNGKKAAIAGDADFYAWGLGPRHDNRDKHLLPDSQTDIIRAVGVQSFPGPTAATTVLVFAVNNYDRVSNPALTEYDIYVDVDGDGTDDYVVVSFDEGAILTGTSNGITGSFVFSTRSSGAAIDFDATAPTDSSAVLLPVLGSRLCRSREPCLSPASNPRITYHAFGFNQTGGVDHGTGELASFNVWNSAISTGGFAAGVAPGASDASNVISIKSTEWARTPAKGVMVVTFDNASGEAEAQLIGVTIN